MPKIKNKTRQYLFKNNLNIRRKSKRKLIEESFLMMVFGLFLLLINYFIPKKMSFFNSFEKNIIDIFRNLIEILSFSLDILIALFISFTLLLSLFLILGSISRLVKVIRSKSNKITIR